MPCFFILCAPVGRTTGTGPAAGGVMRPGRGARLCCVWGDEEWGEGWGAHLDCGRKIRTRSAVSRHAARGLIRRCAFDLHNLVRRSVLGLTPHPMRCPVRRRWSVNVVVRLRHMGGRVLRERLSRAGFPLMTASATTGRKARADACLACPRHPFHWCRRASCIVSATARGSRHRRRRFWQ